MIQTVTCDDPSKLSQIIKSHLKPDTFLMLDIDHTTVDTATQKIMDPTLPSIIKQTMKSNNFAFLTARPCSDNALSYTLQKLGPQIHGNSKVTKGECTMLTANNKTCSCTTSQWPVIFTGGYSKGEAAKRWFMKNNKQPPKHIIFADDQPGYIRSMHDFAGPNLTLIKMPEPMNQTVATHNTFLHWFNNRYNSVVNPR